MTIAPLVRRLALAAALGLPGLAGPGAHARGGLEDAHLRLL